MKVTERGWPGHFILGHRCVFHRNTLIEGKHDRVVVSTVGGLLDQNEEQDTLGPDRYYETQIFGAVQRGPYIEADIEDERRSDLRCAICAKSADDLPKDVDNQANDMHEAIVQEFTKLLSEN